MLYEFQQRVYENKVKRNFNVSEVGPEIILMSEEVGELSDAVLKNDREGVIDALGDILVYCLGLSAMFGWNADEFSRKVSYGDEPETWQDFIPYISKSLGMFAKTYKKSNKQMVHAIDRLEDFHAHIGALIGYCLDFLSFIRVKEEMVLENIISQNKKRTHEGYMSEKEAHDN